MNMLINMKHNYESDIEFNKAYISYFANRHGCCNIVKHLNAKIKNNKEMMMFAVSHSYHIYDTLPIVLKNDKDVINCAKKSGWTKIKK